MSLSKSADMRAAPAPLPATSTISASSLRRRKYLPTMMLAVTMMTPDPTAITRQCEMKRCSSSLEKEKKRQPREQTRPPMTP